MKKSCMANMLLDANIATWCIAATANNALPKEKLWHASWMSVGKAESPTATGDYYTCDRNRQPGPWPKSHKVRCGNVPGNNRFPSTTKWPRIWNSNLRSFRCRRTKRLKGNTFPWGNASETGVSSSRESRKICLARSRSWNGCDAQLDGSVHTPKLKT